MDPNATLAQIRDIVPALIRACDAGDELDASAVADLAAAFENLDHWIRSGGALPADWTRARH